MCRILDLLATSVSSVAALPSPTGLGVGPVLTEQVESIGTAMAVLARELAVRMAALEATDPDSGVTGTAVASGVPSALAPRLRRTGIFARTHPQVARAWESGRIGVDHATALADGARRLPDPGLREQLIEVVLPVLGALDAKQARLAIAFAVDQLHPGDPDRDEAAEHSARHLSWGTAPRGGITFQGYLPQAEADAFTAAIDALVEDLRIRGDRISAAQRRADALAALVARATAQGLPAGGGLPATLTLTVDLDQAQRIAAKDPNHHHQRHQRRPRSGATGNTGRHLGDSAVRFGLCCAAITPILTTGPQPEPDHPGGSEPGGCEPGACEPAAPGSLLAKILHTRAEPLALGRAVRLATGPQRKAINLRDGGCVIPGCTVPAAYTQPHHITGWALDGPTDLKNLVSLCWVHHRHTELGRYTITPRTPGQPKPQDALEHPHWWITHNHPW